MTSKPVTMANQEWKGPIGQIIRKHTSERDLDVADAEDGSGASRGAASTMTAKTTVVSFKAASNQWQCSKIVKRLTSETWESASAQGDSRSPMEKAMMKKACKVTWLHQTVNRMARRLEPHAVHEEI